MSGLGLGLGLSNSNVAGLGSSSVSDPAAAAYIAAVETADGQPLETLARNALDALFAGWRADGDLVKLKAGAILGCARTLAGCLTPLIPGTTAQCVNVGFVSGDRTRALGLKNTTNNKYLLTGLTNNSNPVANYHQLYYVTALDTLIGIYGGAGGTGATQMHVGNTATTNLFARAKSSTVNNSAATSKLGLLGVSRASSANFQFYHSDTVATIAQTTDAVGGAFDSVVFGRNTLGTVNLFTDARMLFFSEGEAISTAFRARLNTFAAAIASLV